MNILDLHIPLWSSFLMKYRINVIAKEKTLFPSFDQRQRERQTERQTERLTEKLESDKETASRKEITTLKFEEKNLGLVASSISRLLKVHVTTYRQLAKIFHKSFQKTFECKRDQIHEKNMWKKKEGNQGYGKCVLSLTEMFR